MFSVKSEDLTCASTEEAAELDVLASGVVGHMTLTHSLAKVRSNQHNVNGNSTNHHHHSSNPNSTNLNSSSSSIQQ